MHEHIKLDLGCGAEQRQHHIDGFIGIDIRDYGWNVVRDVTKGMPYCDDSVDEILADNFFEHLSNDDWIYVLNECHRILKPGGTIKLLVPPYTHSNAYSDPSHKSFWATGSFSYITGKRPRNSSIGLKHWDIISAEDREDAIIRVMTPKKEA